jgi:hypothetical protein
MAERKPSNRTKKKKAQKLRNPAAAQAILGKHCCNKNCLLQLSIEDVLRERCPLVDLTVRYVNSSFPCFPPTLILLNVNHAFSQIEIFFPKYIPDRSCQEDERTNFLVHHLKSHRVVLSSSHKDDPTEAEDLEWINLVDTTNDIEEVRLSGLFRHIIAVFVCFVAMGAKLSPSLVNL